MTPGMRTASVRIGCGAGFSGDRLAPAVDLVRDGALDYLILECLGERTIALGQLQKTHNPNVGYDALLERRARALLPELVATGTRLVTNFGSANPLAAGHRLVEIAGELGLSERVRVAVVTGDDVLARLDLCAPAWEDGVALDRHGEIVSAHAYIGAEALLPALRSGADVIVAGRVADPSLCLAPLVHEFGWRLDDRATDGRVLRGSSAEAGRRAGHSWLPDRGGHVGRGSDPDQTARNRRCARSAHHHRATALRGDESERLSDP
jgi:hypothetical protein